MNVRDMTEASARIAPRGSHARHLALCTLAARTAAR